ncbi:MAG: cation transporter, partial [Eubacterium sp.]|nr:cation transporter [Eubacterium sp.]
TAFLVKHFIKNHEEIDNPKVYAAYGKLSGIVGILWNIVLFLIKFFVGLFSKSTAIIADAFNNLSDALSSIINVVSAYLAEKPIDKKHPFGYGRIEYIATLIIAFLVTYIGIQFFRNSVDAILHPKDLRMSSFLFVFLIFTVLVKLWLFLFNRNLFTRTNNLTMKATSVDSLFDVITCTITLISSAVFYLFRINIDGIAGLIVSCVVIWNGISIIKDAVNLLLGGPMDEVLTDNIKNLALSCNGVVGVHDLIVHSYGPGKTMATIHLEISQKSSLNDAHSIADEVENKVKEETGVMMVAHIDPVELEDKRVLLIHKRLRRILDILDPVLEYHDLQVVFEKTEDLISFDLVLPYDYTEEKAVHTEKQIKELMEEMNRRYRCTIVLDRGHLENV